MKEVDLAQDRVRGMKNIAEFIGEDERRCYYLATRGLLGASSGRATVTSD